MKKVKTANDNFKVIEEHLRNYNHYKAGIVNMEKMLENMLPPITASYELKENSMSTFTKHSSTEVYAIERIESKRALEIHEDIAVYKLLVECIDAAIKELEEEEQAFIHSRYFSNHTYDRTTIETGYSISGVFKIRRSVRKKLLISLKDIVHLQVH